MTYDEICAAAKTLNLLATDRTLRLSSLTLGCETEFPIYIGDDYVAINAFDIEKAVELHACPYFPLGHMIFFPDTCPEINERIGMLDVIRPA